MLATALSPALLGDAAGATVTAGPATEWIEAGAQPCGDLCDARWSLDRMRGVMPQHVYAEFTRRIDSGQPTTHAEVVTGDLIVAVSYANAGMPHVDLTRRVAQFPEGVQFPAEGHAVLYDGLEYRFVRVETWDNWALIVDVARSSAFTPSSAPVRHGSPASGSGSGGSGSSGGGSGGGGSGGASLDAAAFGVDGGHSSVGGPGFGVGLGGGGLGNGGSAGDGLDKALLPPSLTPPDGLQKPPMPMPIPLPGGLALLGGALTLLAAGCSRAAPRR